MIINNSFIVNKLNSLAYKLVIEIVIAIFIINFIYSLIYYYIYKHNNKSFIKSNSLQNKIDYNNFLYFSNTLFFSLGYNVYPNTDIVRFICISQLYLSFIVITLIIK